MSIVEEKVCIPLCGHGTDNGGKVKILIEGMMDYMNPRDSIAAGLVLQQKACSIAS
jgi:hypothetical protein